MRSSAGLHSSEAVVEQGQPRLPQQHTCGASSTHTEQLTAAEIEVGQLTKLNHDRNPEDLKEGQTILLPAGKLSFRDKEILAGIGSGNYRTYPVRKSETVEDIISKRSITRAEVDFLNQGVNLNKLSGARAREQREIVQRVSHVSTRLFLNKRSCTGSATPLIVFLRHCMAVSSTVLLTIFGTPHPILCTQACFQPQSSLQWIAFDSRGSARAQRSS